MAGMFYSLKEVIGKLNKTEDEIRNIVKEGRLREFRDGSNLLFKVDEVESLLSDTDIKTAKAAPPKTEDEEISLVAEPETPAEPTAADTTSLASEGINILGETDTEYTMTDDTMAETKAAPGSTSFMKDAAAETDKGSEEASLEEIEENVNLDTSGSGSGLLDLSLQADDTSLGGILDEIYTTESKEEQAQAPETAQMEAAEAEQILTEQETAAQQAAVADAAAPQVVSVYAEPAPDRISNALGVMLFLPLLATIYTAVVALASLKNTMPSILTAVKSLIWPIVIGGWVVSGLIVGVALVLGKGGSKAEKKPKAKKEKKAKKDKKSKKAAVTAEEPKAPEAQTAEKETQQAEVPEMELSDFETPASEDEEKLA